MLFSRSTLPDVKDLMTARFRVKEISNSPAFHTMIWDWHKRRPGFAETQEVGPEHYTGYRWRNYAFWFDDGEPQVCISINEREVFGYEIHIAAAPKTKPLYVRWAVRWVGDLLTQNDCRIISYFPKSHRAAARLNREFLHLEAEIMVDGEPWVRYATSAQEYRRRFKEVVE